jgi:LDH2 family malate/lactate/ureidoglycolate dehydrogenase
MIIKILPSSGNDFHGVQYNDKKVENGKGELMLMKNFPSFINEESSKEQVRDYFKSISNNKRVKTLSFMQLFLPSFRNTVKKN